ncbi:T9SS type A sorting domain-containing protein [Portibacter lacus]|uniref:Secretion system C-terminal sorting domain-containing protein n=2 Tax=Portibacter lacus TaxID=1099794 RepID=A0AA37WG30_9BACT|nr:T9SS type A sorting domain-containing protein [Portibacter lacus]GLR17580.1 hypothetical protein GCM10007940_21950 [Portibacter lacus]
MPFFLLSQDYNWELEVAPYGRNVNKIHIYKDGKIFILGGNPRNDSIQFAAEKRDAATEWVVRLDNPGKPMINDAYFKGDEIYAAGDNYSFLISNNRGLEWEEKSLPQTDSIVNFYSVAVTQDNDIFIVGGRIGKDSTGIIYKSSDDGLTWSVSDFMVPCLKSVYFVDGQNGFSAGEKGAVLQTKDAGNTWTSLDIMDAQVARYFEDIMFIDENKGFILGGNIVSDSVQTILRTDDGGETWLAIIDEIGPVLKDLDFLGSDFGIAVGNNGASLRTDDGGDTWEPFQLPEVNELWFFNTVYIHNLNTALIGGNVGAIFWSVDYGTLSSKEVGLPSYLVDVSPNPTTGLLHINYTGELMIKKLEIYDLKGQKLKSVNWQGGRKLQLDISDLDKSLYLLKLIDTENNYLTRMIIKH